MTSMRTRERLVSRLRNEGISDEDVLDAIRNVPRHIFVDEALASRAYEDIALPIGMGQTISQPFIVALMTQAIVAAPTPSRILEIGTGCGYQTAVLASLVSRVYTVERIELLLTRARQRLRALEVNNVWFRHGDGNAGWPECEPFDAVLVYGGAPARSRTACSTARRRRAARHPHWGFPPADIECIHAYRVRDE